jgi:hypothetical protein
MFVVLVLALEMLGAQQQPFAPEYFARHVRCPVADPVMAFCQRKQ